MKPAPDTARIFFALWPDAAVCSRLAVWQTSLQRLCGGRVMRNESLHSTLLFLGSVALHRIGELQAAAREVGGAEFELCLDMAGYWGHNHIVYAAPQYVPQQLSMLVAALRQNLDAHHFEFDRRSYFPHVTLLRKVRCQNAALPPLPPVHWKIRDFALVQAESHDGLAGYRVLVRFPLT